MGQPIGNYNKGKVQVTIWENDFQGKKSLGFTIKKRYMDKDGAWKEANSFTEPDLRDLVFILNRICEGSVKMRKIEPKPVAPTSTAPEFEGEPGPEFTSDF